MTDEIDMYANAEGFELSRSSLDVVFDKLKVCAQKSGIVEHITGETAVRGGFKKQYTLSIDTRVAQILFYPNDDSLEITAATLAYEEPSFLDPKEQDMVTEFISVYLESELTVTRGVTRREQFTIARFDETPETYIDVDYFDNDGKKIKFSDTADVKPENVTVEEYLSMIAIDVLALRRPMYLSDLEAFENLTDIIASE
jgi:hypothetical protein